MTDAVDTDIAAVARIDAVPSILEIACRITGLRFAAVARVTETTWTACAVRDEIDFGLAAGGSLDLKTTICDEIRDSRKGVIIDHVSEDPDFCDHHTPRLYGFESYISIPIFTKGAFFGTLCALDPLPKKLSDPGIVATFEGFAQLIGLQLDLQDTIVRKDAQLVDADRSAEIRERFIAILGHDLRNPLAAIEAGNTMLGRLALGERAGSILGQMGQSARRIATLVDDILDFARGRLGSGLILRRKPVPNLGALIREVIAELQLVHPERPINVDLALDEPMTCDVGRIMQLVSNLVGNALTHGAKNEPVTVSATSIDGVFCLSVANGGAPIPQAVLPMLFEPFKGSSEGQPGDGLGLGLFIANEIAKAHGGALDVVSDIRETRFTFSMPNIA